MPAILEQSHDIRLTLFDSITRLIQPRKYKITYQMFSLPAESDEDIHSMHQNSAFLKINLFLARLLDESVAFTLTDMYIAEKFLVEYDNNFVVLPDLDDVTLLDCLHRKLQAIAGEMSIVSKVSILDTDTELTYHSFYDDEDEGALTLPIAKDWCGELAFWETPWWDRYDVMTFDNIATDIEERDAHRADADRASLRAPFDDIDENIKDILKKAKNLIVNEDEHKEDCEVVDLTSARLRKKEKWTPTIV